MKKFKANYTYSDPNFVIQNLNENPVDSDLLPILNEIEADLQRDIPAPIHSSIEGVIHSRHSIFYKNLCTKKEEDLFEDEKVIKYLLSATMRMQIVIIELLANNYLQPDKLWKFNVLIPNDEEFEIFEGITYRNELYGLVQVYGPGAVEFAIDELFCTINQLLKLKNKPKLKKPVFEVEVKYLENEFIYDENSINIDFSLFKPYTDENEQHPNVIFVRADNQ